MTLSNLIQMRMMMSDWVWIILGIPTLVLIVGLLTLWVSLTFWMLYDKWKAGRK